MAPRASGALVTGLLQDEGTGQLISGRLYIQSASGEWFFAASAETNSPAIPYARTNWVNLNAMECHVTLPTGAFRVELPPGRYTFTAERGKEYFPATTTIEVEGDPQLVRLSLRRWVNLGERGWFSGDTHVHRNLEELPVLLRAEDLNVALPQTYWVTKAFTPPAAGDRNEAVEPPAKLIRADAHHVIWPRNTEYEIFLSGRKIAHPRGGVPA